jgi:hypothetical protein
VTYTGDVVQGASIERQTPGIGVDALAHKSDFQGTTSDLWATGGCLAGCLWH